MKIEIKDLHGHVFYMEMDEDQTVMRLKEAIAAKNDLREKYNPELLKLLCVGKVMDNDDKLKEWNIKPDGYLVLVKQTPGKPKPPPKKKPAQSSSDPMSGFASPFGISGLSNPLSMHSLQNNLFLEQPCTQSPFSAGTASATPLLINNPYSATTSASPSLRLSKKAPVLSANQAESVEALVAKGFDRARAERALIACEYDLTTALDRLTSGDGPSEPAPSATAFGLPSPGTFNSHQSSIFNPPSPSTSVPPPLAPTPSALRLSPVENRPSSPQSEDDDFDLTELCRILQEEPEKVPLVTKLLKESHPEMATIIDADPRAFINALRQAALEQDDGSPSPTPTSEPVYINVTPQDRLALQRLQEMGFAEQRALEAYIACDRNEQLAINYLLSVSD